MSKKLLGRTILAVVLGASVFLTPRCEAQTEIAAATPLRPIDEVTADDAQPVDSKDSLTAIANCPRNRL
jgi:hypothetical protein